MFAWAVHDPVQSALHLVVQVAVVETGTHVVVQWSSQQAPHEAWQSVDDALDVHDALQPAEQRVLQSLVQSNVGGLVEQVVVQSELQVDTQVASAAIVHCALHCCSSFAAHACSQPAGAHWVAQLF